MNIDLSLLNEVTAFLSTEADMLDNKEYESWLQLWAEDGLYIVPVDHSVTDYKHSLNVAYDDAEMRTLRVNRLTSGEAVSTTDAKKTVRTLSRFRVLADEDDVVTVRCAYCLFEDNKNGIRQFPANLQFRLVRDGSSFKILEKVVKIMKSDQHLTTISYLF